MSLLQILGMMALAPLIHEAGHFLFALMFGQRLRFTWAGWRVVWKMPVLQEWQERLVAKAGFGLEIAVGAVLARQFPDLAWPFVLAMGAEWWLYPKSEYSDFKWL